MNSQGNWEIQNGSGSGIRNSQGTFDNGIRARIDPGLVNSESILISSEPILVNSEPNFVNSDPNFVNSDPISVNSDSVIFNA